MALMHMTPWAHSVGLPLLLGASDVGEHVRRQLAVGAQDAMPIPAYKDRVHESDLLHLQDQGAGGESFHCLLAT